MINITWQTLADTLRSLLRRFFLLISDMCCRLLCLLGRMYSLNKLSLIGRLA